MPAWLIITEWCARLILVGLFILSIWSVAIILDRKKIFKAIKLEATPKELDEWLKTQNTSELSKWVSTQKTFKSGVVKSLLEAAKGDSEQIDRAIKKHLSEERLVLEKGMTALATFASNAPFIGLVGTVLGIINAFGALAASQSNTNMVMSGISEALVATAVGLFVAIPAGIAYNIFSRELKVLFIGCENLRDQFIAFKKG